MKVNFPLPAISEVTKDVSVVSTVTVSPCYALQSYIENTEYNAFFAELELGQAFFYSGKKKDGIFLKTSAGTAILVMPNVAEGNDEVFAALYGQSFKFKKDTPITTVSVHLDFQNPHVESSLPVVAQPKVLGEVTGNA